MNVKAIGCAILLAFVATTAPASAGDVYLNVMNKTLDDWYNMLDRVCREMPGGSDASDLACNQRNQVSALLKRMACWNIYPATGPRDTSYWKCRQ